jgi:hypothetical protein
MTEAAIGKAFWRDTSLRCGIGRMGALEARSRMALSLSGGFANARSR